MVRIPRAIIVVNARIRFRSDWVMACTDPMSAVIPPTMTKVAIQAGVDPKIGCRRASRYMPALTMVAECRKALIGVGALMAFGSQK